jgi:hypothetical protein
MPAVAAGLPTKLTYRSMVLAGVVYLAENSGAEQSRLTDADNAAELSIELKVETIEQKESRTGQGGIIARAPKSKEAKIKLKLTSFNKRNLAMALYGTALDVAGATATNELIATAVTGGSYALKYQNVTTFTSLIDSAGTPVTLVAGTDFTVDLVYGRINILTTAKTTAAVFPLKATYTYGAVENIALFMTAPPERFLRLEGVNVSEGNKATLTELYRVVFDPIKNLDMISDKFGEIELEGTLLIDTAKIGDPALGGFGRMVFIG